MPRKQNADQKYNDNYTIFGFKIGTRVPPKVVITDAHSVVQVVVETMVRGGSTDSAARLCGGHPLEFGAGTAGIKPCDHVKNTELR